MTSHTHYTHEADVFHVHAVCVSLTGLSSQRICYRADTGTLCHLYQHIGYTSGAYHGSIDRQIVYRICRIWNLQNLFEIKSKLKA